jgi:putative endonuclease
LQIKIKFYQIGTSQDSQGGHGGRLKSVRCGFDSCSWHHFAKASWCEALEDQEVVLHSFMRRRTFMHYYVYILKLSNGDYYVGKTNNLNRRIKEHYSGQVKTTRMFFPKSVETVIRFSNKELAFRFEKYLKTGSGIAFRKRHLV